MRRSVGAATALALVTVLAACGSVTAGSPRVVGEGPPIYGQPVSAYVRAELDIAAAARAIDPCRLLDESLIAALGNVIAYGPAGDLSTCHAELILPGAAPSNPAWIEVTVGATEPSEGVGTPQMIAGTEVFGPSGVGVPGTCALHFELPMHDGVPGIAPTRWGHVSYLDGGAGADCVVARSIVESVLPRLNPGSARGGGPWDRPLAHRDPCEVVEAVAATRSVELWVPGSRPHECRIVLGGGDEAVVAFALAPEPVHESGGLSDVELDGRRFAYFQDAVNCNYYFYPGEVFETNKPSSPAAERAKIGNRLTASVSASAASCGDAQILAQAAAEMFDY